MVVSCSKTSHSLLDTLVDAAEADVLDLAGDVVAMVAGPERGGGGHQHAGLAAAALRHLVENSQRVNPIKGFSLAAASGGSQVR